jgi:hypothetical protein
MSRVVGFNSNDFFYTNVNAPIRFNKTLCDLSDADLIRDISNQLNLKITHGNQPTLNNTAGQCVLTKIDTSKMTDAEKSNLTKSWKMQYSTDGAGAQSCNCVADNTYISSDPSVFSTSMGSPIEPSAYYSCVNSSSTSVQDKGINVVNLDDNQIQTLKDKTFDYYKSVCRNKSLADELQKKKSANSGGDQKYEDAKTLYNREYLNRINLGVGIIATCGLIYYTAITTPY